MCAIVEGGKVVCWDEHDETLMPIIDIVDAVQISVAEDFACARRATGAVACWWGIPVVSSDLSYAPFDDAVDVSAVDHLTGACAVRSTGEALCWKPGGASSPFPG